MFSERAASIVAENRIRATIEAGEFERLPGLGRPSPLIDEPYDPFWCVRQVLQREQIRVNPRDGWLGIGDRA